MNRLAGVHDFRTDLAWSHRQSELPFWKEAYEKQWPGCTCVSHPEDGPHQRDGIDRSVILPNTKQILIDEKCRRPRPGGAFKDILIEYVSNDRTKAPGWAVKPLRADYIAYAIPQDGKVYLLPVDALQAAWRLNADAWIAKYKSLPAHNRGYDTLNCPVPVGVLFPAMGAWFRVACTPVSCEDFDRFMRGEAA